MTASRAVLARDQKPSAVSTWNRSLCSPSAGVIVAAYNADREMNGIKPPTMG